jgi:hypothetical protein
VVPPALRSAPAIATAPAVEPTPSDPPAVMVESRLVRLVSELVVDRFYHSATTKFTLSNLNVEGLF